MRAIKDVRRKLEQKTEEVQRLKHALAKAESYVEAMQETLKILEKEASSDNGGATIRPGSMVDKARNALGQAGKPLHIEELLGHIGKEVNKKNRASLAGSLGTYVREKIVFTRPQPATFGLVEFEIEDEESSEPPNDFGL